MSEKNIIVPAKTLIDWGKFGKKSGFKFMIMALDNDGLMYPQYAHSQEEIDNIKSFLDIQDHKIHGIHNVSYF